MQQLQTKAAILERAKHTAERRLATDVAAERRQQADLKQQLKQLQVCKARLCWAGHAGFALNSLCNEVH
jgi:hypothetical protein